MGNSSGVVTIDGKTIHFLTVEEGSDEYGITIHMENSVTSYPWDVWISIDAHIEPYTCYDDCSHDVVVEIYNDSEEVYYENGYYGDCFEVCLQVGRLQESG